MGGHMQALVARFGSLTQQHLRGQAPVQEPIDADPFRNPGQFLGHQGQGVSPSNFDAPAASPPPGSSEEGRRR